MADTAQATLEPTGLTVDLVANPSHLEMIGPVVTGKTRAAQTYTGDTERKRVLPLLIHGDAAFSASGTL